MLQSSTEIKAQLLSEANIHDSGPSITPEKRNHYIEVGMAVKRMAGTKGWKIVEAWLLRNLDITKILEATPEKLPFVQAKAQAFAEVVRQVNYWITLAEQLEQTDKKEG